MFTASEIFRLKTVFSGYTLPSNGNSLHVLNIILNTFPPKFSSSSPLGLKIKASWFKQSLAAKHEFVMTDLPVVQRLRYVCIKHKTY